MLKPALIFENKEAGQNVYVEFSQERFTDLLKEYFQETKDIEKALNRIIEDLKKETFNK